MKIIIIIGSAKPNFVVIIVFSMARVKNTARKAVVEKPKLRQAVVDRMSVVLARRRKSAGATEPTATRAQSVGHGCRRKQHKDPLPCVVEDCSMTFVTLQTLERHCVYKHALHADGVPATPAEVASAHLDAKTRHRTKKTEEGLSPPVKRKHIPRPSKFPPEEPVEKRRKDFRSVPRRWDELVCTDHLAVPDVPDVPDSPLSSESVAVLRVKQTYTSKELREMAVALESRPLDLPPEWVPEERVPPEYLACLLWERPQTSVPDLVDQATSIHRWTPNIREYARRCLSAMIVDRAQLFRELRGMIPTEVDPTTAVAALLRIRAFLDVNDGRPS